MPFFLYLSNFSYLHTQGHKQNQLSILISKLIFQFYDEEKVIDDKIYETEEEQKRFDGALRRRQLRLILAGKMKPDEATELKALFTN